jgi:nucleoside-diphosphate-sugar epimerase
MRATVVGAAGFIGRRLVAHLRGLGWDCRAPARDDATFVGDGLGTVFYCAGLTADYAGRPHDTVRSHVGLLNEILARSRFDALVYLSSTRLYDGLPDTGWLVDEDTPLALDPARPRHFYDLSKALGESLCRQAGGARARIARLSCVHAGAGTDDGFLGSLLDRLGQSTPGTTVTVDSTPHAVRDYVHVDDVLAALVSISYGAVFYIAAVAMIAVPLLYGVLYLWARNVGNAQLFARLGELSGCELRAARDDRPPAPPGVSIDRMRRELGWQPTPLMDRLPALVTEARSCRR